MAESSANPLVSPGLVTVAHVVKTFGDKRALRDVTFSVPAGQVCGLVGPNGAGKTTLFRLLMGILKATSGKLAIDGLDTFEDRVELKRRIGFQFQLTAEIHHFAAEYSRGMKKKLGLLLALPHRPKLLILDEPTNVLDVEATHLFYGLILSLAAQGTRALFSTHLMHQVMRVCSHVID